MEYCRSCIIEFFITRSDYIYFVPLYISLFRKLTRFFFYNLKCKQSVYNLSRIKNVMMNTLTLLQFANILFILTILFKMSNKNARFDPRIAMKGALIFFPKLTLFFWCWTLQRHNASGCLESFIDFLLHFGNRRPTFLAITFRRSTLNGFACASPRQILRAN